MRKALVRNAIIRDNRSCEQLSMLTCDPATNASPRILSFKGLTTGGQWKSVAHSI